MLTSSLICLGQFSAPLWPIEGQVRPLHYDDSFSDYYAFDVSATIDFGQTSTGTVDWGLLDAIGGSGGTATRYRFDPGTNKIYTVEGDPWTTQLWIPVDGVDECFTLTTNYFIRPAIRAGWETNYPSSTSFFSNAYSKGGETATSLLTVVRSGIDLSQSDITLNTKYLWLKDIIRANFERDRAPGCSSDTNGYFLADPLGGMYMLLDQRIGPENWKVSSTDRIPLLPNVQDLGYPQWVDWWDNLRMWVWRDISPTTGVWEVKTPNDLGSFVLPNTRLLDWFFPSERHWRPSYFLGEGSQFTRRSYVYPDDAINMDSAFLTAHDVPFTVGTVDVATGPQTPGWFVGMYDRFRLSSTHPLPSYTGPFPTVTVPRVYIPYANLAGSFKRDPFGMNRDAAYDIVEDTEFDVVLFENVPTNGTSINYTNRIWATWPNPSPLPSTEPIGTASRFDMAVQENWNATTSSPSSYSIDVTWTGTAGTNALTNIVYTASSSASEITTNTVSFQTTQHRNDPNWDMVDGTDTVDYGADPYTKSFSSMWTGFDIFEDGAGNKPLYDPYIYRQFRSGNFEDTWPPTEEFTSSYTNYLGTVGIFDRPGVVQEIPGFIYDSLSENFGLDGPIGAVYYAEGSKSYDDPIPCGNLFERYRYDWRHFDGYLKANPTIQGNLSNVRGGMDSLGRGYLYYYARPLNNPVNGNLGLSNINTTYVETVSYTVTRVYEDCYSAPGVPEQCFFSTQVFCATISPTQSITDIYANIPKTCFTYDPCAEFGLPGCPETICSGVTYTFSSGHDNTITKEFVYDDFGAGLVTNRWTLFNPGGNIYSNAFNFELFDIDRTNLGGVYDPSPPDPACCGYNRKTIVRGFQVYFRYLVDLRDVSGGRFKYHN